MKIKCNREKFAHYFGLASLAVAIKDVRPILQNVKMIANQEGILLMATDGEIGIRIFMSEDVQVDESGEAILPTRLFKGILQESHDKEIFLEFSEEKTLIYGERSRYELQTQPVREFPDLTDFEADNYYKIDGKILRTMIRRTIFSTETENSQYALGGILFEFDEDKISAVSTDGRRLSFQCGNAERIGENKSEELTICPPKLLSLIDRSLEESKPVLIKVEGTKIRIKNEGIVIQSQLVNGRFPRWRAIIPGTEDKKQVDIMAGPFLSAVRQASIVSNDKESSINICFSNGKVEFLSQGLEVGESHIELPVAYDGESIRIKLDPRYLIQMLGIFNPEELLNFYFKEKSAVLFKTNDGYTHLIMPLS